MLLRRVTEHVKAQNWFAVFLDFVIVVVGVFIGIQVANWNDARLQRHTEREFLVQLRNEIAESVRVLEFQSRYVNEVVASGRRGLAFLNGGDDCVSQCEALLVDFFHASQVWGTPYDYTKYQEAKRIGFPSSPVVSTKVQEFYSYLNGWDTVNGAAPPYRERIRSYFTPEAAEHLWTGCMRLPGSVIEELTRDCIDDLKALDVKAMLQDIRADPALARELQFWLGQNIFALTGYPDMIRYAEAANTAIAEEIGLAP
ncbi:hypothetical protein [Hyphococcus sp.]|uniref:hypothetical protein n=1 Tax=Hyphococcus sp. TaxID=2038636 RepID=UPI003CCBBB6C